MLSLLLVLAGVGLLITVGLRVCMYLYGAGALRYRSMRRARRQQEYIPAVVTDGETEEALAVAETEYLANLVHSLER
jgi:membrane protein required for beta-lactamase induction